MLFLLLTKTLVNSIEYSASTTVRHLFAFFRTESMILWNESWVYLLLWSLIVIPCSYGEYFVVSNLFVFFFWVFGFRVFWVLVVGFWDFDYVCGVVGLSVLVPSIRLATWKYSVGAWGIGVGFVDGCIHSFFFLLLLAEVLLTVFLLLLLMILLPFQVLLPLSWPFWEGCDNCRL